MRVMPGDTDPPSTTAPRLRRTWPQRLTIAGAAVGALASFAAAAALYGGQRVVEDRNLVSIVNPADRQGDADAALDPSGSLPRPDGDEDEPAAAPANGAAADASSAASAPEPVATFPPAEPEARNFLVTGADNNSCIDPDSPYAPAFGERSDLGERSDTIMMWRVNPTTSQVAVLSFPRDLWVTIPGRAGKQRINVAYERDAPQQLIDTIYANFEVPTDHFIQIDFCAFKTLVDAVGGVKVPFADAIRDENTGLNVPEPGCFEFDGDHALAYVRSRKLEVLSDTGEWEQDGSSDLGRISRQQDFIRRIADELLSAGAFDPAVVRGLVETNSEYVVVDSELTARKILEFAGVLRSVDPAAITTYQVQARPATIQGNAVLEPVVSSENMQAVLSVFQGRATLSNAPEQLLADDADPTTDAARGTGSDGGGATGSASDAETGAARAGGESGESGESDESGDRAAGGEGTIPAATTTLPEVDPDEVVFGYVPDDTISC